MEIFIFIVLLVIGFIIGYLYNNFKNKKSINDEFQIISEKLKNVENENIKLFAKLQTIEEEKLTLRNEISEWKEKYDEKTLELQESREKLVLTESELKHLNEKLETQKLEIEDLQAKFKMEFENLANKIFEEKSEKFLNINKLNLSDILTPFKEKIENFEKKVEETYDKEYREKLKLETEIKRLYDLSNKINEEASNLTNALKSNIKTMGDWGEMILERILEEAGLTKDREYFKQLTLKSELNKNERPDFVVKLPEGRNIIIDSKVSLVAYEKYVNSKDTKEQERYLKEHMNSIKSHIDGLSKKNYQELYGFSSIDYVFMFIPIEPAFLVAIKNDSTLWQYAYSKKILLISPTNLIAIMKIVEKIWQQDKQNRNAYEIAKQGADLYDKFVAFIEDLQEIGKNIIKAENSYNNAFKKLSEGRDNLILRTKKLKEFGISPKKQIPKDLINEE